VACGSALEAAVRCWYRTAESPVPAGLSAAASFFVFPTAIPATRLLLRLPVAAGQPPGHLSGEGAAAERVGRLATGDRQRQQPEPEGSGKQR